MDGMKGNNENRWMRTFCQFDKTRLNICTKYYLGGRECPQWIKIILEKTSELCRFSRLEKLEQVHSFLPKPLYSFREERDFVIVFLLSRERIRKVLSSECCFDFWSKNKGQLLLGFDHLSFTEIPSPTYTLHLD